MSLATAGGTTPHARPGGGGARRGRRNLNFPYRPSSHARSSSCRSDRTAAALRGTRALVAFTSCLTIDTRTSAPAHDVPSGRAVGTDCTSTGQGGRPGTPARPRYSKAAVGNVRHGQQQQQQQQQQLCKEKTVSRHHRKSTRIATGTCVYWPKRQRNREGAERDRA